jgi:NAD-specific glutamate dehydrogenase
VNAVDQGPHPLLSQVLERIREEPPALIDFAKAYLRRIPYEADMSPDSATEEIRRLFEFIRHRRDTVDVHLFNPEPETAGTVIQVRVQDVPFLIDSVTAEIQAHGLEVARVLHPVIGVVRDDSGTLRQIVRPSETAQRESVQLYELDRRLAEVDHPNLEARIRAVIGDVLAAVRDFRAMVDATQRMIEVAEQGKLSYPDDEVAEAVAFLQWLTEDNFVFLGYREYQVVDTPRGPGSSWSPTAAWGSFPTRRSPRCASPSRSRSSPRKWSPVTGKAGCWSSPRPTASPPSTGGPAWTT